MCLSYAHKLSFNFFIYSYVHIAVLFMESINQLIHYLTINYKVSTNKHTHTLSIKKCRKIYASLSCNQVLQLDFFPERKRFLMRAKYFPSQTGWGFGSIKLRKDALEIRVCSSQFTFERQNWFWYFFFTQNARSFRNPRGTKIPAAPVIPTLIENTQEIYWFIQSCLSKFISCGDRSVWKFYFC